MERKRKETIGRLAGGALALPAALDAQGLSKLLEGRKYWTERGYDLVAGEYRYTVTIVLAEGDQAVRDD